MIALRKCEPRDFGFYYDLKCEPASLYWGGFDTPPERERLLAHFTSVFIEGCDRELLIIEGEGEPLGYIQLNYEGELVELGITVSERYCGRGVATAAYTYLFNSYDGIKGKKPYALIREDNYPSERSLCKFGFARTGAYEDRYYKQDGKEMRLFRYERL